MRVAQKNSGKKISIILRMMHKNGRQKRCKPKMLLVLIVIAIILGIITFLSVIGKFWIAMILTFIFGVTAGVVFFIFKKIFGRAGEM
jgi:Na+/melibiose symporter-like transporter